MEAAAEGISNVGPTDCLRVVREAAHCVVKAVALLKATATMRSVAMNLFIMR